MNRHALIRKWHDRAVEHEKLSERMIVAGNPVSANTHQLIADVFRLCASDLSKI